MVLQGYFDWRWVSELMGSEARVDGLLGKLNQSPDKENVSYLISYNIQAHLLVYEKSNHRLKNNSQPS